VIALILAILCGILLFRAVTLPLGKLLGIVDHMRRGDFSERLTLERRDEFSTLRRRQWHGRRPRRADRPRSSRASR
jgi:methyl-accepting chemotaxis protein